MVPAVLLGANWLRYQCGFADTVDKLDVNNNDCRVVDIGVDVSVVRSVDLTSFLFPALAGRLLAPAPHQLTVSRTRELASSLIDMCINMNT